MAADHSYSALQVSLDYTFQDLELLERALTHASAGVDVNYERLEFLGDRVLGLVVSELLLERFPTESEGDIGRRFAQLVRAETLAQVGRDVGIDAALRLGGNGANESIIADATEAVIAALYLDGGLPAAVEFIERLWTPLIGVADVPPSDETTTGKPQAIASSGADGTPSRRDGKQKMSEACR